MSHALLSPSSASRWIACTPSARLESQFPDRGSSASEEGTLAHKLGETLIRKALGEIKPGAFKKAMVEITASEYYGQDMQEHCEAYATYVLERFSAAKAKTKDAIILLEQKLDLTEWVPEGFGTADVQIIADGTLELIDLKYGKGVPVSAEGNAQLRLYAAGAVAENIIFYSVENVRYTIFQPRLDSISSEELTVKELDGWLEYIVRPAAHAAWQGMGDFQPGKHCKFCKAAGICKANADKQMELAKYEFRKADLMSPEEVSDVLFRAEDFTAWVKAVEEHALREARDNGASWPGFKLVEGRSNRRYTDEVEILAELTAADIEASEVIQPAKLLGVTALEKVLGKEKFNTLVGPYVTKPAGAPTLAPRTDKRPELNSTAAAQEVFAKEIL